MTVAQVARRAGATASTVTKWIRRGRVTADGSVVRLTAKLEPGLGGWHYTITETAWRVFMRHRFPYRRR